MIPDVSAEVRELIAQLNGTDLAREAYDELQTFRRRGLLIAAAAADVPEKMEMVAAARVLLRDALRELVARLPRPRLFE